MEEIKVGEYVRTEKGTIAKIDDVEWDLLYEISSMKPKYKHWIDRNKCRTEFIVKHSSNIIELIEVGDYVNGKKISNVDKIDNANILEGEDGIYSTEISNDKFIKSLVTKEQFSSVEYRLEDNT